MATRVLLASDGSAFSHRAAEFVVRLSKVVPVTAEAAQVVDLHYVEYKMVADLYVDMIKQGADEAAQEVVDREVEYLAAHGVEAQPRLLHGRPGPVLCGAAEEEGFSLVAMGRKGHRGDLSDLLFGSVSSYVVHHATKPVLIVKAMAPIASGADARRPLRVLVGADGSMGADRCVEFLAGLGASAGLEVCLLHVVNPDRQHLEHLPADIRFRALERAHEQAESMLATRAERLRATGVPVLTRVEQGTPRKTICRVYEEDGYEVVALGRRGTGFLEDAVFGSVANSVLHHCPGHVLMVP